MISSMHIADFISPFFLANTADASFRFISIVSESHLTLPLKTMASMKSGMRYDMGSCLKRGEGKRG